MSEKDNEFEEKELDSEDENDEIENSDEDEENNPDIDPELTKLDNDYLGEQGEDYDKVQPINLSNVMQTSFLDYAMSVIVSRALPDVRDGLKPVHRRILFAMNELGVYSDKPHKKSARIVGDVIGKYHPHGDTAVYEAMVRMAQDFSYRYPLVDGHGNFGSVDGDGAAAMRYTEARMSKLAGEMLRDLNKNTVDFVDNYDGSEKEPAILPARFPNLLVNGASGIAVGMATSIPPHNLTEVINGTLALIENPDITVEKLMEYIPAPDFPTGATIMGLSSVKQAYLTGVGTVTVRAKVNIVNLQNEKTTHGVDYRVMMVAPYIHPDVVEFFRFKAINDKVNISTLSIEKTIGLISDSENIKDLNKNYDSIIFDLKTLDVQQFVDKINSFRLIT